MDYICAAFKRVKYWWYPKEEPVLIPLNPRNKIMDPPPTLEELEKEMARKSQDIDKVIYFYKPKSKLW